MSCVKRGRDVRLEVRSDRAGEGCTEDARPEAEAHCGHLSERPVFRFDDAWRRTRHRIVHGLLRERRRALDVGELTLEASGPFEAGVRGVGRRSGRGIGSGAVRPSGHLSRGQER